MTKFQQELGVLLVVNSIMFCEFRTMSLGLLNVIFMTAFALLMWRKEK